MLTVALWYNSQDMGGASFNLGKKCFMTVIQENTSAAFLVMKGKAQSIAWNGEQETKEAKLLK